MRAKQRQSDRKAQVRGVRLAADQPVDRAGQCDRAKGEGGAVDQCRGHLRAAQRYRDDRYPEQSRDTPHLQQDGRNHVRALVAPDALFPDRASIGVSAEPDSTLSRTPRPPDLLTAPSLIIPLPAPSSAPLRVTS